MTLRERYEVDCLRGGEGKPVAGGVSTKRSAC